MKLILLSGPNCGLCNEAKAIIQQCSVASTLEIKEYNIRDDVNLYHRYAVRIPVVKRSDTDTELGWPFSLQDLELFLQ